MCWRKDEYSATVKCCSRTAIYFYVIFILYFLSKKVLKEGGLGTQKQVKLASERSFLVGRGFRVFCL